MSYNYSVSGGYTPGMYDYANYQREGKQGGNGLGKAALAGTAAVGLAAATGNMNFVKNGLKTAGKQVDDGFVGGLKNSGKYAKGGLESAFNSIKSFGRKALQRGDEILNGKTASKVVDTSDNPIQPKSVEIKDGTLDVAPQTLVTPNLTNLNPSLPNQSAVRQISTQEMLDSATMAPTQSKAAMEETAKLNSLLFS